MKNHLSATIGGNLRYWRNRRGITQEQLAERLGVSKQSIAHVEGGSRNFSVPLLRKAAEVLEVSADALLFDRKEISILDQNILHLLADKTESEKAAIEEIIRLCGHLCSGESPFVQEKDD